MNIKRDIKMNIHGIFFGKTNWKFVFSSHGFIDLVCHVLKFEFLHFNSLKLDFSDAVLKSIEKYLMFIFHAGCACVVCF